jgi:hypothetical protein
MRIRTIKPEMLDDSKAGRLGDAAWRLFVSMWILADDYGNLPLDASWIHRRVFWARNDRDPSFTEKVIVELEGQGMIACYEVRGQTYCHIVNWGKHQRVDKPGNPRVPKGDDVEAVPRRLVARDPSSIREGSANLRETLAPDRDRDPDRDPDQSAARGGANLSLLAVAQTTAQPKTTRNAKPLDLAQLVYPWPDVAARAAMEDWAAHRQELRQPLTKLAAEKLLKRYRESSAAFVRDIEWSISNGWRGVHPPNESQQPGAAPRDLRSLSSKAEQDMKDMDERYGT